MLRDGLLLRVDTDRLVRGQRLDGQSFRLDLFVRVLALEEFAGRNTFGIALYTKLIRSKDRRMSHTPGDFEKLMYSVRADGVRRENPLVITHDFVLRHGMHRLACAVFFGIPDLPVTISPPKTERPDYSVHRLQAIGFTAAEIEQVLAAERRYSPRDQNAGTSNFQAG
jgi:hypothetical protein